MHSRGSHTNYVGRNQIAPNDAAWLVTPLDGLDSARQFRELSDGLDSARQFRELSALVVGVYLALLQLGGVLGIENGGSRDRGGAWHSRLADQRPPCLLVSPRLVARPTWSDMSKLEERVRVCMKF
jgi:hypothetical protein